MTTVTKPCLDCGRRCSPGPRCDDCRRARDRHRNTTRRQYAGGWQTLSRAARAAEPWCHCDLPGHGHPGTCGATTDLTLDHQHHRVECRPCNSAHRRNP